MIASSSTFRPHPGRVIRDLFRLLDAVTALYGSTSLQQSSKGSCSLLVSGYNLRADCQWRTLVPPLNSGANAAPASVLALITGNSVFDIRSLTWDEWSYPEGVILPIVTLGTIRPEDSGAARNATSFIIKLYSETQVSGRLGMSGGISPRHAQNPLSGERRKTLSITHHALSPPPSHHYLYIIHLIN